MRRSPLRLCAVLTAFTVVGLPRFALAQPMPPAESSVAIASEVTRARDRLNDALARDDLPVAWLAMRAWKEAAPTEPAARLAEAQLYLRLAAPAAAISSANAGLLVLHESTRTLERPLLSLKAQAHAAVGEPAPAWAGYSRLLQLSSNADDPLARTARRARWAAFAQFTSGDAYDRFLSRLLAAAAGPTAPPAAHLRLAQWLAFSGQSEDARATLRHALTLHPRARELEVALAHQLLVAAIDAHEKGTGLEDAAIAADLARLVADPSIDPFTHAVLGFWALLPEATPPPAGSAPKLPASRGPLEGLITATTLTMEHASEQAVNFDSRALPPLAELVALEKTAAEAFVTQRAVDAKLQTLPASEEEFPYRQLALTASEGLPQTVILLRDWRHRAQAAAMLEAAKTPAQILDAAEQVIAAGDHRPAVWRARFAAAVALDDIPEALASGARAFATEWMLSEAGVDGALPAATVALEEQLEKLVGVAPGLVRQAVTAWENGDAVAALAAVDRALAIDPASPTAWRLRWKWSEAAGDDAAALVALERWWRLDQAAPDDASAALAFAARMGAWALVLSLADARLDYVPSDAEAHLFRAHAAIACDRFDVARESLAVVDVSTHRNTGKLLQFIAHTLDATRNSRGTPVAGLIGVQGTPEAPRGLDEWEAYHRRLARGVAPASAAASVDLAAKPAAIHVERLDGRMSADDYGARTRGTPEAAMARWVNLLIARQAGVTDETKAIAALVARDPTLPLAARAVAHRFRVVDEGLPVASAMRASDPYYATTARARDGDRGAPGQELVITTEVQAADLHSEWPVRLRGVVGSRARLALSQPLSPVDEGVLPTRLWELRNLSAELKRPLVAEGAQGAVVLDVAGVNFDWASTLTVDRAARIIDSNAPMLSLTLAAGATLETRDFEATLSDSSLAGTWRASGGRLEFGQAARVAATGRVTMADATLGGVLPFTLTPGAEVTWRNVIGSSRAPWPATLPEGWTIDGARLTAAVAREATVAPIVKLAAPHRGEIYALADRDAVPTVRVETIDALHAALAAARPGAVIELGRGEHQLAKPLEVPPGVSVRAGPDTKIVMSTASPAAFQFFKPGARRVRDFVVSVQQHMTTVAGIAVAYEDLREKSAVFVGGGAWVFLEGGRFSQWHHRVHTVAQVAAGGRLELRDHWIEDRTKIAVGGVLVRAPAAFDPLGALRATVAAQARAEQRLRVAERFARDLAGASDRTQREQAIRVMSDGIGQTGFFTGASAAETTRTTMELLNPVLLRYPDESPQLLAAVRNFHARELDTVQAMIPDRVRGFLRAYVESYREMQRIGSDKVSMENVYRFQLTYPPGHADYAAAKAAMERGLTIEQIAAELALSKQRAIELAAKLEKQRAAAAAQWAEQRKREARYAATAQNSPDTSGGSTWSANSYAPRSYSAPAWTPSESYKMQVYKQNLDVQISRSIGRY